MGMTFTSKCSSACMPPTGTQTRSPQRVPLPVCCQLEHSQQHTLNVGQLDADSLQSFKSVKKTFCSIEFQLFVPQTCYVLSSHSSISITDVLMHVSVCACVRACVCACMCAYVRAYVRACVVGYMNVCVCCGCLLYTSPSPRD